MGKKFVASYSGGKDSVLAIDRSLSAGMQPVALITTFNTDRKRSWFHGIPDAILKRVSRSVGIPLWFLETSGEEYTRNFEKELRKAKEHGAEVCVFGDIDIEAHRVWCTERCVAAGLEVYFPLWGEKRDRIVSEFIDKGYTATLTVVDTSRMAESFLGKNLTVALVDKMRSAGVDVCGENGEYHTFVSDGPIFKVPISFSFGEKQKEKKYASLPLMP